MPSEQPAEETKPAERAITINGFTVQESEITSVTIKRDGEYTTISRPEPKQKPIGFRP